MFDGDHLSDKSKTLLDFTSHLVNPEQCTVHHFFARAYCYGRNSIISSIATFRNGFDCGKVLVVAIAIAEEEQLPDACALFQTNGMVAEKLAGSSYQGNVTIEQCDRESRPNSPSVFIKPVGNP